MAVHSRSGAIRIVRGRWTERLALAVAGAVILLLALWLRNPLIPYGGGSPRASDFSSDSGRADDAARRRADAIQSVTAEVVSTQPRLASIAALALEAPADPESAFAAVRKLPDAPDVGVIVIDGGDPLAWAGQLRVTPADTGPGTSAAFSPFYTTLQVVTEKGKRRAIATSLIHAEPPSDRVATALDSRVSGRKLVESFRFAPASDSPEGELITGAGGNPLMRVDATPLSAEMVRFDKTAAARGRGTVLVGLALLILMALGWSDRRSLGSRLFTLAIALAAIALIPWNNFSNFARIFDPAYFYSVLAGPLTANAGAFAMSGSLAALAVMALIRARRTRMNRAIAGAGAIAMLVSGLVIARSAASGIALPLIGSTSSLWITWEIPLFLTLFAFWLAATWLGKIATGRRPMVQLRTGVLVAIFAGATATFLVWTTTTEQRLQLAMRDVEGLQKVDADAAVLLGRFGAQLSTYDSPGTRADVLKRYAISDLAPAEVQVSLGTWKADGSQVTRLDLAPLTFDSVALGALVKEAIGAGQPIIRQTLGPIGRQVMLAVPHREGGATAAVASPRTRLIAQDPYATLLGFVQPDQTEPPYTLTLADVTPGTAAGTGTMTWRRLGNEWHGDELIATSEGTARAHVEVDIRSWPTRLVRACLIVILDIAVAGLLWALGAMAEGGFFRWVRRRASAWLRSYRGRLTLALFMFFVVPAVSFAAWAYERLQGYDLDARQLVVRETLEAAARDHPAAPEKSHAAGSTPLFLYSNALLTASSDSLYEMIAPAGRTLPRGVQLSIADGGELTATWRQAIGTSMISWGYRAASDSVHGSYVLAAPARRDEIVLDRRRRDLTLLVLFATAVGAIAAFWLSGIAARVLARDLELSRIEVGRAERVLAWGEMARQVAHEIKNPLTPIRLGVQHLRRARADARIDFDRVLDENVTRILAEIDRLDEIARAFSRYGTAPSELPAAAPVDVAAILRDVVGLEKIGIGGVSWTLHGAEGSVLAQARADEMRDVLLNVFENARLARARKVVVSLFRLDKVVRIVIEDDGAGIARAALPRVFEPHFSTRTTGSGLGLAISRRLLESWGGTIDLSSEEGQGARVIITLHPVPA
ncbi:MAG: HAMP domain-containing sensor histidine kinase [Gemmatimonadaceae bacterium]|nr:HAMP domain-containing sensor histidine kinase [Gemmatimonadaceae bacterium]